MAAVLTLDTGSVAARTSSPAQSWSEPASSRVAAAALFVGAAPSIPKYRPYAGGGRHPTGSRLRSVARSTRRRRPPATCPRGVVALARNSRSPRQSVEHRYPTPLKLPRHNVEPRYPTPLKLPRCGGGGRGSGRMGEAPTASAQSRSPEARAGGERGKKRGYFFATTSRMLAKRLLPAPAATGLRAAASSWITSSWGSSWRNPEGCAGMSWPYFLRPEQ